MDFSAFRSELRQKKLRPSYLFTGSQELLKEGALAALRGAVGTGSVRRLAANETSATEILELQRNLPLLDPVAVIVVRPAARLAKADMAVLAEAIAGIQTGPVLVFWDETLDKRQKLFAAIAKAGGEVELGPLKRPDTVRWVNARARELGHALAPRLAEMLVDLLGTDLMLLATTLEKLSIAVGAGQEIREQTVVDLVPAARAHALYELQDALSGRAALAAVRIFRSVLDEGEAPQLLVGALAAEVRRLLLAREVSPRLDSASAAQWIGTRPFKVDDLVRNARAFPSARLREAVDRLHAIDLASKTGGGDVAAALEDWIVWLCAPAKADVREAGRGR